MALLDYYYNSVSLLLHCDGANASTTFTDNGPLTRTMTAGGAAQISTAQSEFGGASASFNGASWVSTPAFAGVDFGAGDFTVEGWVRFTNTASALEFVMSNHASSNANSTATFCVYRDATGKLVSTGFNGSSAVGLCTSTTTLAAGVWYSFAYVRSGSNYTLFINGTSESTATSALALNTSVDTFALGRPGAANTTLMTGYIDEVRITKGYARYPANYTPAVEAFPNTVTAGSGVMTLGAPPFAFAAYLGASAFNAAPMGTVALYAGDALAVTAPMQLATGYFGEVMKFAAPMASVNLLAHDATGENALNATAPMATVQAQSGDSLAAAAPMATVVASMTLTNQAILNAVAPMGQAAATGAASAVAQVNASAPMATMIGYGGSVISARVGLQTFAASGTSGNIGRIVGTAPLYQVTAVATTGAMAEMNLIAPMAQVGIGARNVLYALSPMARVTLIGTATVAATYEAYSLNLNHKPRRGEAPVDELTHYTSFPFDRILRYKGSYFGVAGDGLYLLQGTTAAPWNIQTAFTDFDETAKKTVVSAYFGGRMAPAATVTLLVGEVNTKTFTYTTPRTSDAKNFRQMFGRGNKSRYYALGATGTGVLALDNIEFNVATMTRRI